MSSFDEVDAEICNLYWKVAYLFAAKDSPGALAGTPESPLSKKEVEEAMEFVDKFFWLYGTYYALGYKKIPNFGSGRQTQFDSEADRQTFELESRRLEKKLTSMLPKLKEIVLRYQAKVAAKKA